MQRGNERFPWKIRPGRATDAPFLGRMLVEAAFWRAAQIRPPLEKALADPHLRRYIAGWGRPGDAAVVAQNRAGRPAGAAWYRLFKEEAPGYGFIDAATPELSIGVLPEWRGVGVGRALLAAL